MQNFKDTSIRIKGETKKKLDKICKEIEYKTIDDCIVDMLNFFIQNGISPQVNLNVNLHASLDQLNANFLKRDDSFRKWFGDLYYKKLGVLIANSDNIYRQNEMILGLIKKDFEEELTNIIEGYNLKKQSDETEDSIKNEEWESKMYSVIEQKDSLLNDEKKSNEQLKNTINKLLAKAERKSVFDSSYIIKLTKEEFENLSLNKHI